MERRAREPIPELIQVFEDLRRAIERSCRAGVVAGGWSVSSPLNESTCCCSAMCSTSSNRENGWTRYAAVGGPTIAESRGNGRRNRGRILQQNRESISILVRSTAKARYHIPAMAPSGEPLYESKGIRLPSVRSTWSAITTGLALHLRGTRYDLIGRRWPTRWDWANKRQRPVSP